ncbi:molybdopterin-guanine dinucleotide biosynthesis protein B [Methanoplanus sp. FWC-SCC4]|uniref:Molybdopterin-guanine dinucleotide biosynthesis protein B n=1 Tax=Methanochimaera problematica TaxID=2609417 RepID=A0AA97FCX5_9EURY|nr:molybdopterin-guanine dinucleotide biosynthesis protein MobB [Methanoplanus sp. FWC-SCC4]WOF15743.1 molybdopterin-guanine dinucleotide biosynthesis protein B [Methanoplanus sp. FWC-SCC4]
MKIIHVAGTSNSGKTLFIHQLLDKMTVMFPGKVGVIKHLGHHIYDQVSDKDTSTHYEHGAAYVAGIDAEKAMVAIRNGKLSDMLDFLSDSGMEYTIIEGFKTEGFKKIIKGDLEAENCILRDPDVNTVINSLDNFDDYFTMQGIIKNLKNNTDISKAGAILSFNGIVREITGDEKTEYMDFYDYEKIDNLVNELKIDMEKVPGILGVRFHHNKGRLYAGEDVTYIAVIASHRQEAFTAMMNAIDILKEKLHDAGKELV